MGAVARMVEAGRIERRRYRVNARRLHGMGHAWQQDVEVWHRICGRAYRVVNGGYP